MDSIIGYTLTEQKLPITEDTLSEHKRIIVICCSCLGLCSCFSHHSLSTTLTVQQDPKWLPTLGSESDHKYELFVLITYPKTGYNSRIKEADLFLNNIIIHLDYVGTDYS